MPSCNSSGKSGRIWNDKLTTAGIRPLISLASQSFVYGLGSFGRSLVLYITIPLLTANMGLESFGVVSVLISMLSFFDMLSNAGLPAATFRLYNDDDNPANQSDILGTSLLLFVIFAAVLGLVVWAFADQIAIQLLDDVRYAPTIRIVAILLVFATLIYYVQIVLRIQVRPKAKVLLDFVLIIAQAGAALVLVIIYSLGAFGYWLGQLAGAVLGLLVGIWLIRGTIALTSSRQKAIELLHYGLPLLPAAIGLWALRLADRWLITASLGLTEVAIYEVGYKVGMITALLIPPFLIAWPQFAFSRIHSPNAPRTYRNVLTTLAASIMFLALFVISFRHELVALMAPAEYAAAAIVVPWIALSQVAFALYPVLSLGPKIAKNTILLSVVTLISCLVNLGLNFLLIPRIGILGAAYATFVGYWVLAIVVYIIGNRYFAFPIDWRRLAKVALAAIMTVFVTALVADDVNVQWQRLLLQAGSLLIYPLILIVVGFISLDQLREGWHLGLLQARRLLSAN